ncbi:MAG: hypothetical protein ACTHOL_05350 [Luteibacter jiangsuensis]
MLHRTQNLAQSANVKFGSGVTKTVVGIVRSADCLAYGTQLAVNAMRTAREKTRS